MTNTICLDENYSTTRVVTQEKLEIINNPENKFETVLFLLEGENRKGEGGLRTKGYFKKSYENKPLISIITVVFNGEKYLEETIQSVINQTYDNVEYIIIDGGSSDRTLDIIKKYENKIDYWISERDNGIYDAMNKGIRVSSGEWVSFLGADDFLKKNAIESYLNALNGDLKIKYISSKIELINNKKQVLSIVGKALEWNTFKKYMCVAHVGSLHHKSLFCKYGLFDISYKIAGDYEFLLRIAKNNNILFLNKITARMINEGVSNQNIKVAFKESNNAKINTARRNILISYFEYYIWHLKIFIKKNIKCLKNKDNNL